MKMRMSHARMSQLVALFGGDLRTYDLAAESTLLKAGFEMRVLWLFPVGSHRFGLAIQDGSS